MSRSTRKRVMALGVVASLGAALSVPSAHAFYAKTHRNLAEQVARKGGMTNSTTITNLRTEAVWADTSASEDNIGAYAYDEELNPWYDTGVTIPGANADHWLDIANYDSWLLQPDGEAHKVAQDFYSNAKTAFSNGNDAKGWKLLGRGTHYIQDLGQPYHAVFWENADALGPGHLEYESWVDANWTALNLDSWAKSGAAHAYELNGKSVSEIVVGLARISKSHLQYVRDGKYSSNPWATQDMIYYTARAMAAAHKQVVGNRLTY